MVRLEIPLSSDTYTVGKSADELIRVQLDGGAGRYAKDLFGISDIVSCSFICPDSDFNYLKNFYNGSVATGESFLMSLMIDGFELADYECRFMPNTFTVTGTRGLTTFVSATVEAIRYTEPSVTDSDIWALISEFGRDYETQFPIYEDILNTIVNINLPSDYN